MKRDYIWLYIALFTMGVVWLVVTTHYGVFTGGRFP